MSFLYKRKKIFLFVLLFFILVSTNNNVYAQAVVLPVADQQGNIINPQTGQITAAAGTAAANTQQATLDKNNQSVWTPIFDGIQGIVFFLLAAPTYFFFMLSTLLLGLASSGLDLALRIGVIGISDIVHGSSTIKDSWEIFRNLANVGIIFAILFIAIKTVLGSSGYDGKVLLGRVIIAALLMNFSFFLGAIVVDVSNKMALTIYDSIAEITGKDDDGTAKIGRFYLSTTHTAVLTTAFKKNIDANQKKYDEATNNSKNNSSSEESTINDFKIAGAHLAVGWIMGGITNLVLATIFFVANGMIIGRLIGILLLLIVAPLAFASSILPKTQKYSEEWWGSLIGQSFFLPAFLLLVYVGINITKKLPELGFRSSNTENLEGFAQLVVSLTPKVIMFSIVIGLFIAALTLAKKMSSQGNAVVGAISSKVSSSYGGVMAKTAAVIGVNTVGAGASVLSKNEKFQDWVRNRGVLGGLINKNIDGIAKSSFDYRNSKVFKGVASATNVGKDFAENFKPSKDGFKGQSERLAKSIEATYEAIPDKSDAEIKKAGGGAIIDKRDEARDKLTKATTDLQDAIESGDQQRIKDAKSEIKKAQDNEKDAQEKYEMEKNPAKASFIQKQEQPISIKNVWVNAPRTEAAKKIKEKIRGKEDTKEAKLLQKLIDSQKSNP